MTSEEHPKTGSPAEDERRPSALTLTRRDAMSAAVIGGAATSAAALALPTSDDTRTEASDTPIDEQGLETLLAVAEVVYPSEVRPTEGFVRAYLDVQSDERVGGIVTAVDGLNRMARRWEGEPFSGLPIARRDALLNEIGIDRVEPDPDGDTTERIRYYLVNGLLFALFTSPRGSKHLGIRNPVGHPGGYESLFRSPQT